MNKAKITRKEIYARDKVAVFENTITVEGKDVHRISLSFGKNAVLIIPIDDKGDFYLVKERRSDGQIKIDFPSGGVEENEAPIEAARRELSEEIGYEGELEYLGLYEPFYSLVDMKLNIFVAKKIKKQTSDKKLSPEFYESIEVLKHTEKEIFEIIAKENIVGFYTLGALSILKAHKLKLPLGKTNL